MVSSNISIMDSWTRVSLTYLKGIIGVVGWHWKQRLSISCVIAL